MDYGFTALEDISISSEQLDAIDRHHQSGRLVGDVEVFTTASDAATHMSLFRSGHAGIRVVGSAGGEIELDQAGRIAR